jgi:hypothetical protein
MAQNSRRKQPKSEILRQAFSFREEIEVSASHWPQSRVKSRSEGNKADIEINLSKYNKMKRVHNDMPSLVVLLGSESLRSQIINPRIKSITVEGLDENSRLTPEVEAAYMGALALLALETHKPVFGQIVDQEVTINPDEL